MNWLLPGLTEVSPIMACYVCLDWELARTPSTQACGRGKAHDKTIIKFMSVARVAGIHDSFQSTETLRRPCWGDGG